MTVIIQKRAFLSVSCFEPGTNRVQFFFRNGRSPTKKPWSYSIAAELPFLLMVMILWGTVFSILPLFPFTFLQAVQGNTLHFYSFYKVTLNISTVCTRLTHVVVVVVVKRKIRAHPRPSEHPPVRGKKCCFSRSAHWLPTRKKLLYTVANPARGLLNRGKKKKSLAAPPHPRALLVRRK